MKIFSMLLIGLGLVLLLPSLLLSAVAFSDAYHRCPGEQCSDALDSGMIGAFFALAALTLGGAGVFCLRFFRS